MTRAAWTVREKDEGVEVVVYVQPRARKTEIAGLHGGLLKLKVAAPPVDNAANTEVLRFFASLLGVPRSRTTIVAGEKAREKTVRIEGISLRDLNSLLQREIPA